MAKPKKPAENGWQPRRNCKNKRTSIGRSKNSRPKGKRRNRERKYRGQGR